MTGEVTLPAPLVPAEVDLAAYQFMPLDVRRLRDSGLVVNVSGDGFMAWMMLVCASWHQIPAASIPDDDKELANLAGFGRGIKEWKRVRAEAIYGWVKCSDGRFYHPVVAEKAMEAWERRQDHRETENNKTERQRRWRERVKSLSNRLRELGVTPPTNASLEQLETLVAESEASTVDGIASTNGVSVDGKTSTEASTRDGQDSVSVDPPETAKTGQDKTRQQDKSLEALVPGSAGDPPGQATVVGIETQLAAKERRLREITAEAVETYNASPFTKAHGGSCPNIQPTNLKAADYVRRAIKQVQAICQHVYGSSTITRQFWVDYWATVNEDEFCSGRGKPSAGHANWTPDFEFLVKPERIAKLFDKAMSEPAA